jgi:hypothetical protein
MGHAGTPPLVAMVIGAVLIGIWLAESSVALSWIFGLIGAVFFFGGLAGLLLGRETV